MPLGMGFGQSRFSGPNRIFRLLYAAYDLATAIAVTIVRDRFEVTQDRALDYSEIGDWAVIEATAAACRSMPNNMISSNASRRSARVDIPHLTTYMSPRRL